MNRSFAWLDAGRSPTRKLPEPTSGLAPPGAGQRQIASTAARPLYRLKVDLSGRPARKGAVPLDDRRQPWVMSPGSAGN